MTSAASGGRGGSADTRRTGRFGLAGLVVLLLGAALIPLPLDVVETGDLVEVGPALTLVFEPGSDGDPPVERVVRGAYLTPRRARATPATLLLGGISPARRIAAHDAPARADGHSVLDAAALAGLGIAPVRIGPDARPVTVDLDGSMGIGRRSLAAALHVFDTLAEIDLAGGRRIVALGDVAPDDTLRCTPGFGRTLAAPVAAEVDVVVLPRACGPPRAAAAAKRVLVADAFPDVLRLLGSG